MDLLVPIAVCVAATAATAAAWMGFTRRRGGGGADGSVDRRSDGAVLFADGGGEDCRNCGGSGGVRGARIATVPDRDAERVPLCDDCRIAAAARDDAPEDCATIGRRVAPVGGADGRCDNCGYLGRLSAHAVVPLSDAGRPHHANAVALCETCHDAAHGRRETEPAT